MLREDERMGKITVQMRNTMTQKYSMNFEISVGRHLLADTTRREETRHDGISVLTATIISAYEKQLGGFNFNPSINSVSNGFIRSDHCPILSGNRVEWFGELPKKRKFYHSFLCDISNWHLVARSFNSVGAESEVLTSDISLEAVETVCKLAPFPNHSRVSTGFRSVGGNISFLYNIRLPFNSHNIRIHRFRSIAIEQLYGD